VFLFDLGPRVCLAARSRDAGEAEAAADKATAGEGAGRGKATR